MPHMTQAIAARSRGPVAATLLVWLSSAAALAEEHIALTVVDDGTARVFDIARLEGMGPVDIVTSTPWTDSAERFTGVPLARLLDDPSAGEGTVMLIALNDYRISMPLAEVGPDMPIVAFRRDGRSMSIRDKGPYWVIYPFDAGDDYQTETVFSRSVWQLVRIEVAR